MSRYMKSTYEYTKVRRNFGRQPLFQDVRAHMLDSINPNKADQKEYMLRNPVHRYVQATNPQSEHTANTKRIVTHEQGINHTEGGWPREVHLYNDEHLARHRRRVMHDDNYVRTVLNLAPLMQHYVDQNNAIDMYEAYFDSIAPQEGVEKYNVRTANVFRDPHNRPISCIVWTNEKRSKLAVAYCDKSYINNFIAYPRNNICYLWDINRPTEPAHELEPDEACWQLACSPVDPEILVGGLENGTVCLFDIRYGTTTVSKSSVYNSHREPVTSLLYTHSRSNTEFFTGSPEGQCLWWDSRNLSKPIDNLPISVKVKSEEVATSPDLSNAEGVSTLEFNHGVPTKFLCGTESGLVINVNRMGKTLSEKMTSYWNVHSGPIRAVSRSPCTLRMFLSCADYSVRVWSEEVRTAPIIVTRPFRYEVMDACWAPLRFSSYMSVCAGGIFYYWDFLRKYKEPSITLQVSKHGLTRITPHRNGRSIAIGDVNGSLFLLQLSENMTLPGNHDKQLMSQAYQRETRREHILDSRLKEIHLKMRTEEETAAAVATEEEGMEENEPEEDDLQEAEKQYFKIVKEELRQMEVTTTSSAISIS